MIPLEKVFLKLGAEVVSSLNVFMSKNPEKASRDLKRKLMMAVNQINASNNEAIKKKVRLELERLNAAGGISKIAPEEGITFFIDHKGEKEFVKLTGTFAPLNQIIGLTYRL